MAEGCGASCAKVLLIIFNFIFWLSGAAILAIGIWILVDQNFKHYFDILAAVDSSGPLLKYAAYVLIGVGAFVFLVGFLGCCGAIKESRCLLGLYIVCLVITMCAELAVGILVIIYRSKYMFCLVLVLIGELAAGILTLIYKNKYMIFLVVVASGELIAGVLTVVLRDEYIFFLVIVMAGELAAGVIVLLYKNKYILFLVVVMAGELAAGVFVLVKKDTVKEELKKTWQETITDHYGQAAEKDQAFTRAMDIFQIKLKCCGTEGPGDYAGSKWKEEQAANIKMPYSCCVLKAGAEESTNVTANDVEDPTKCQGEIKEGDNSYYHDKGCYEAAVMWFDKHAIILIGVGIGIACLELFGFIFAVLLCRNANPRE